MPTPAFVIKTVESVYRDHHIYLNNFSEDFSELLFLINSACAGVDTLHFHMYNSGGDLYLAAQIMFAIEEAVAQGIQIVLYIEAICESMGAVFVCKLINLGAQVHIGPAQYLMFHNVSIGHDSTTCNNVLKDAEATRDLYKDMLVKFCKPMLTDSEIEDIIKGNEFYLKQPELIARIKSIIPSDETIH